VNLSAVAARTGTWKQHRTHLQEDPVKLSTKLALGAAGLSLAAGAPLAFATSGFDRGYDRGSHFELQIVGLTDDQRLVSFTETKPWRTRDLGKINGLVMDGKVVGIDYRPATGDLYAVGDKGGVYTIGKGARATLKSRVNVALQGTTFGVDFNPVVDRLRIVSDTGQNLRDNVDADNDTLTDTTLTSPGPPPVTFMGTAGAAYTNNDADPDTGTTLYDLDANADQVVIQSPANAGLVVPTGKLKVDTGSSVGFDIYSTVRNGSTVRIDAFASLTVGGRDRLYEISLFNGRARSLGKIGGKSAVTDIAIPLAQR
jgi:hypothetical protein